MAIRNVGDRHVLPEAEIRSTAMGGGNLVPKDTTDQDIPIAFQKLWNLAEDLLFTINDIDTPGGHKTAACNLLCTVISQCSRSQVEQFRALVWEERVWAKAFDVFLAQNHALSVKPLRQLLATLTTALDECSDISMAEATKTIILQSLVGILCSTTEHVPIRPAMQALAHFLHKHLMRSHEVYEAICTLRSSAAELEERVVLLDVVLKWAPYDDYSSASGLLASAILESQAQPVTSAIETPIAQPTFHSERQVCWAGPVLTVLEHDPSRLENYRHYVLPELFRHSLPDFVAFIERLGLHEILSGKSSGQSLHLPHAQIERILFCALSVGNKMGLVQIAETQKVGPQDGLFLTSKALCIPDVLLGDLVLRSSTTVRIAGLSMLISSSATTKPLTHSTMKALRIGLPFLHADADAGFRSEMFSLIRNLTDRLRGATSNLAKLHTGHGTIRGKGTMVASDGFKSNDAGRLLHAHERFLSWYISFLKMELRPSASYQRHISAVKCIALVYKSGVDSRILLRLRAKTASPKAVWPFHIDIIDDTVTELLLDLLLDPFDDVRQGAAELLSIAPDMPNDSSLAGLHDSDRLANILGKAEHTMRFTGRADHADGVAHLYNTIYNRCLNTGTVREEWWISRCGVLEKLVSALEHTLEVAAHDMNKAVSEQPLHGIFISLRYIMETPGFYKAFATPDSTSTLQALHLRLYTCFHAVWHCVKTTLCNDAPEGHVPEEVEENDDVDTKDVLSYSWRALKEASLVMRTMAKSCPIIDCTESLMTSDQLKDLGDLSFTQLAELRHHGAFSTVSQTFATCCTRAYQCGGATTEFLDDWYKRALLCIQNQTTINTRRSAGLPALMVGLVIADDGKSDLYQKAFRDLTVEATKPVDEISGNADGLSQVHAMNCLKDMFRNSKLGERSEANIPDALGLASNCLSSKIWAIRNSGLMLFRALLDRLLGTSEAYVDHETAPQSRLSFNAVPNLMNVIFSLISPPLDNTEDLLTEGVFPALQLLQRTPPPAEHLSAVQDAILRLTASSQWHIREIAAETYAVLTHQTQRLARALQLVRAEYVSANALHGALLAARCLLQSRYTKVQHDDLRDIFQALCDAKVALYEAKSCPFTKAAFVDLYNDWCQAAYLSHHKLQITETLPLSTSAELIALFHLDRDTSAACSALRASLSDALLQEHAYLESIDKCNLSDTRAALLGLADSDADACTTALISACTSCSNNPEFTRMSHKPLASVCASLLFDSASYTDIEVQAAAQDVLISLLNSKEASAVQDILSDSTEGLYLPSNAATPLFQDDRLVLQGALLDLRLCGTDMTAQSLSTDFHAWINAVRAALHEDNPFDTRFAASQAAARIQQGLRVVSTAPAFSTPFLIYCLTVYDLTNDDDEEVRNLAAQTACRILHATRFSSHDLDLVPLAAGARLAGFIAQRFDTDITLFATATSRLMDGKGTPREGPSVQQALANASRQDSALFVQEKQNLFLDEVREARLWSQVLMRMSRQAVSPPDLHTLCDWTTHGLETLLSNLDTEADGPLGWKRRPDLFVLGLQVIYAIEALLVLNRDWRGAVPISAAEVRDRLVRLLQRGQANEVHPLLLNQIRKVLARAVRRGVGHVAAVLRGIDRA
ncbi:hypothetical protein AAFC00_003953 [Neodothiora populina]|uniref:DUF2428 domain-containing protein n=1 Tax=Neodothiora populina TaxID=2781224 RepID=A0ABR3PI26_9PEZI